MCEANGIIPKRERTRFGKKWHIKIASIKD
jgi:hypothetical protein